MDGQKIVLDDDMKHLFRIPPGFQGKRWQNLVHGYCKGVLGCALSHLTLWEELSNSEKEACLILEDDAKLEPNFEKKWDRIYSELRSDPNWDIIFLGFFDDTLENQIKYRDSLVCEGVMKFAPVMRFEGGGTHCYCIRKKAANKLLKDAHEEGIQQPIDHFMVDRFDSLCVYRTYPHLAKAPQFGVDGTDSDIQPESRAWIPDNSNN